MPRNQKLRIICYDVSCNRRRRKIAALLEDVASRVQYSVFETRLSPTVLRRLVSGITPLLDKGDSLRIYSIGRTGERHCEVHGSGVPIERNNGYWLL